MPNFIKLKVYQISIFISIIFLSHCEEEKVHSGLSALLLQPLNDGLDRREFLTDEKLKLGVDVDAGFVPTLPKDGEYSSSPGCPKLVKQSIKPGLFFNNSMSVQLLAIHGSGMEMIRPSATSWAIKDLARDT